MPPTNPTTLVTRLGRLTVRDWPDHLRPPFGLERLGEQLVGPARLRWRVRDALERARWPFSDTTNAPTERAIDAPSPHQPPAALPWLTNLRLHGYRGILVGLAEADRVATIRQLLGTLQMPALLITADRAAQALWQTCLADTAVDVVDLDSAERLATRFGSRYDLLLLDHVELLRPTALHHLLDASAALARIAFAARADHRQLLALAAGVGAVVHLADPTPTAEHHELRVPMPAECAERHAAAWHTFLLAFDTFAAHHPKAGFATFLAQARRDPRQRPAVHAWHAAMACAAWHDGKRALVDALLLRHAGERLLVFTPTSEVAYELASRHLLAAVTADLPRQERNAHLAAFAAGKLRALTGPRLLDLGVPEGCADVAILVGGGFGLAQHHARCARVAAGGLVYELVSDNTVEVSRARRWRDRAPAQSPAVPPL